ncbi:MAG: glycosyltransferase [Planctomycetes bacterium]|nr:glycosyltransferase [Planctomycetota bacterium]
MQTCPLRVVHLGKYYPPALGGIEEHTRTLARGQAALGAEVRVLVVNHATATGRDVTFDHFTSTPDADEDDGPVRVTRVGRWANIAKLDIALGLSAAFRRLARWRPDVWHLHTPNVTMMLTLLTCPAVRPLVITHHSDIVRQRFLKQVVRPLEAAIYNRAASILPTSAAYAESSELLQHFASKVTPLPLGIDLEPFQHPNSTALAFADELRRKHGSPLWLCVGRMIYYKGLPLALAALKSVPGTLLVIGTGPLERGLKALAAELEVTERVVFHGPATVDQLVGAYRAATALWFPSTARSEGFGLVQVESMASGCPPINTAIAGSGVPWVCRHEQEGLTVQVNDPNTLAAAVNRLLNEVGLREKLVVGGRARAAAEFDHGAMAERSLEIYRCIRA